MDLCDLAPRYIKSIAPYQPGKPISELAREMGLAEGDIVKLASNENPLGVSPLAREAMARALPDLARYPDGNGFELKQSLSRRFGVSTDCMVLGNGSNDVLELAARAFLAAGDKAVYSQHAFAVYPLATQAAGAIGIEVPARDFGHDVDAMARAIDDRTRIVFIANPNNPTGTLLGAEALYAFLRAVPQRVAVVLDEAYNEYLAESLRSDSIGWLREFPNLILTRTFSKAYGLAGLRVGYAFAHPEVADLMNRVRQPFNVNNLALAGAAAAIHDAAFVRESFELNAAGMAQIVEGLRRLKLAFIPSSGNFLAFECGDGAAVFRQLLRRGVIVRPVGGYGMPRHLRVSIGLASENARFLEALAESLGDAPGAGRPG